MPPPLALLPVNLLPKGLGGLAGEDHRDVDEGGVKKAKFSTFKKIKNKSQLVEEVKKQEEDAAFLDDMFQDNLSDDTEHQDEVRMD